MKLKIGSNFISQQQTQSLYIFFKNYILEQFILNTYLYVGYTMNLSNKIYSSAPEQIPSDFQEITLKHSLLLNVFGIEYLPFLIPEIFNLRGWHLYREDSNLSKMIIQGEDDVIEFGERYALLPNNISGAFFLPPNRLEFIKLNRNHPVFIEVIHDPLVDNAFRAKGVNIHPIESLSLKSNFLDLNINPRFAKEIGVPVLRDSTYTFKIPRDYLPLIAPQIRTPRRLGEIS